MELHTKQFQIGMDSAVAPQLWTLPKMPTGPAHGDFQKKDFQSVALLALLFVMIYSSCRCNLSIARLLSWRTVAIQQNKRNHCIVSQ